MEKSASRKLLFVFDGTHAQHTHNTYRMTDMPPPPGGRGRLVPVLFLLLSMAVAVVAMPARPLPLQPPPPPATTPSVINPTTMYNENIAKTLADYCAAAYSCGSFQGCGNWSCKSCQLHPNAESLRFSGATNGTGIGGGSVSGMVIHDPDLNKIILVFAGTQVTDLIVWANNLNGELIDYPACGGGGCQVHAGFYADYQAIAPSLKESLAYVLARYPHSGLWIAGHSLGGALAMLAVADLKGNHSVHAEAVYTFGQPRVGNQAFAMHLYDLTGRAQPPHIPTPYFRLVHYQDPIPHAPPVLLGFWHAPTEIFYNKDQTSYQVCNDSGEDFYCSNSFLFAYQIEDHLNYLGVPF